MNRVFGKKKNKGPPPSLDKASAGLGDRVTAMDTKIQGLENELRVYKDKMKKAKSPAAKKQLQKSYKIISRVMQSLLFKSKITVWMGFLLEICFMTVFFVIIKNHQFRLTRLTSLSINMLFLKNMFIGNLIFSRIQFALLSLVIVSTT